MSPNLCTIIRHHTYGTLAFHCIYLFTLYIYKIHSSKVSLFSYLYTITIAQNLVKSSCSDIKLNSTSLLEVRRNGFLSCLCHWFSVFLFKSQKLLFVEGLLDTLTSHFSAKIPSKMHLLSLHTHTDPLQKVIFKIHNHFFT